MTAELIEGISVADPGRREVMRAAGTVALAAMAAPVLAQNISSSASQRASAGPSGAALGARLQGVQHFGLTVQNMNRVEFYTEVLEKHDARNARAQAGPGSTTTHRRGVTMAYSIRVNGQAREVDVDGDTPMLWVLRDVVGLTGTKYGCGVAMCGACTIHVDGKARRACFTPVSTVGAAQIRTIESLHETPVGRALERAWRELDVVQCGYCQSGQLMSAAALLEANRKPSDDDIDLVMSGNICRCGTYGRIRAGIHLAARYLEESTA